MGLYDFGRQRYAIDCKDNSIEGLFKAIIILDQEIDTEKMVESLKKRLEKEFKEIPVAKGKVFKKVGDVEYYPNGLVQSKNHCFETLLSGYDFELSENRTRKRKTSSVSYAPIKDSLMLWYWQVRHSLGKSCSLPSDCDLNEYRKSIAFFNKAYNLSDEEKHELRYDLNDAYSKIDKVLQYVMPHQVYRRISLGRSVYRHPETLFQSNRSYRFTQLTPEEIERVKDIFTNTPKQSIDWVMNQFALNKFESKDDKGIISEGCIEPASTYQGKYYEILRVKLGLLANLEKGPVRDILCSLGIIFDGMFDITAKEEKV